MCTFHFFTRIRLKSQSLSSLTPQVWPISKLPPAFQSSFCLRRLQAEINAGKLFNNFHHCRTSAVLWELSGTISLLLVSVCWLFSPPYLWQIYIHLGRGDVAAAEQKFRHPACGACHQPLGQVQDGHDSDGRRCGRTVRHRWSLMFFTDAFIVFAAEMQLNHLRFIFIWVCFC